MSHRRSDRCAPSRVRPATVRALFVSSLMVVVAIGAGCGSDERAIAEPTSSTTPPPSPSSTTTTSAASSTTSTTPATTSPAEVLAETETDPAPTSWQVGARPLPLRADGFGEVLPTPPELIDRRLPTSSALPAPASERFEHRVVPIDSAIAARMGRTWQPGCPVGLDELRYVNVSFWSFDGGHHTGELVLHRDVAEDVVQVFARLHEARFPIEQMRLITDADLDAAPTGDGNNSAAFICRRIRQGSSWSAHAYGLAVDINPFHNPYARAGLVLPELASSYLDRTTVRPGMVLAGDVVTRAFAEIGWFWGGEWRNPDHMHFSQTGR